MNYKNLTTKLMMMLALSGMASANANAQGGKTFEDAEGTIHWPVGNEQSGTVSADIADAISIASVSTGTGLTVETATYFNTQMVKYTPKTSNAGTNEGVMVEYRVKAAAGVTFEPTNVSYAAVKVGTDGATYSWSYTLDGQESSITKIDPKPDLLRNNGVNGTTEYGGTGTAKLMHSHELNVKPVSEFTFRFYISDCANNKNICIGKLTITGIANGETIDVATFDLSAQASPAEGGTVSVYPAAAEYEEGSEVTLTATEAFGYDFVNWTDADGSVVSEEPRFVYTVNADAVLTANFTKVETYALNLTVDGTNDYMVKISPEPTMVDGRMMYEAGQAVQLSADQYEGLVAFTNWSDGDTNSQKLIPMTADVDLTAYYAEADIIAGWDFYLACGSGRKADFASEDNETAALSLVYPDGQTSGWLDKSTMAAGGYESFAGAAVNWRNDVEIGTTWWQTKVNAADFSDINVQFQMLYNYNAYQTYDTEYSLDGEKWTKFGSITMTAAKKAVSFSKQLPAEANNQAELYIRMKADMDSNVDGTESANDGNTLAMFFITGTPKLVDDGMAPVLVSTVPADGATGTSASGRIVLTFDERIQMAADAVGYINDTRINSVTQNPTQGKVNGKTITFEYKGLEYSTEYVFKLSEGSVSDLTGNTLQEDIVINFTTMMRPTVEKHLYDFIVPDDGTLAEALKAAAARTNTSERYRIFLRQGDYVLPANQTAKIVADGDHGDGNYYADPRTYFNTPNVSLIGENPELTTITNEMPTAMVDGQNVLEGIRSSGVLYLQSGATDTYMQDLKLHTTTGDATGRNVILVDGGTRNVYKNVTLWAYQDTYVPDNERGVTYHEGGIIRGRTDFICGGGDVYFNRVTLIMSEDGGYLTAPRGNTHYGYVFKDCTIKGGTSKVDGNYYLGRAWTGGAESYFIDTRMEVLPRAEGWSDWNNGPTRFAEFNSMTASGTTVDLSQRKKSFKNKDAANSDNAPVLTPDEALEIGNMKNTFGDWDPTLLTEQAPTPLNVELAGTELTWTGSNYALLYAIVKEGRVVGFTTDNTYTVDDAEAQWAVRAANEMGGLGEAATADIATGIKVMYNEQCTMNNDVYDLQGRKVNRQDMQPGIFIVDGRKVVIGK